MARGPLYRSDYKPLFSGHETFPLRYGWLKKAHDAVVEDCDVVEGKSTFLNDSAIARFGVGKNMVESIRHWAICSGVIKEDPEIGRLRATTIGTFLFGQGGVDPFLEDPASLWYLHWLLCSEGQDRPLKTTWFWIFNHFTSATFRREELVDSLVRFTEAREWKRVSRITLQRDVECFIRTYESTPSGMHRTVEDHLESPLSELGLVRGFKGNFHLVRGPKPTLPNGVFAVALDSFWASQRAATTLSFEMVAHEPGSPGRVFLLDESDLAGRLLALEEDTKGVFRWSETAGLKQVLRDRPFRGTDLEGMLRKGYRANRPAKASS